MLIDYNFQHPSKRILSTISDKLKGKKIVLGITGSVASFKAIEIARELIRRGADVIPVITSAGKDMIGEDLLWWATGNKPISKITGKLEHIIFTGVMNNPVDLMLIAPCTTNTIAKLAAGIADTTVTLIGSSLQGKGIPIAILSVAHEDLYNSPPVMNAIKLLKKRGISFIEPVIGEGKAKVPEIEDIIFETIDILNDKTLIRKPFVITGGPTREYIDQVRFISNSSSGLTGIEIAKEAYLLGAQVKLVLGPSNLKVPRKIPVNHVITSQDMTNETIRYLKKNPEAVVILSAAMADFKPEQIIDGKIKSGNDLSINLLPTLKLSNELKSKFPKCKLVLFKAEWGLSKDELIESAMKKLTECSADFIVANDLSRPESGFEGIKNHVIIINKDGTNSEFKETKMKLASIILNHIQNVKKI